MTYHKKGIHCEGPHGLCVREETSLSDPPKKLMNRICPQCSREFHCKPSHYAKRVYCSRTCMADGYTERLAGSTNPNYKAVPLRTCEECGGQYRSYSRARKYCSDKCSRKVNVRRCPAIALKGALAPKTRKSPRKTYGPCPVCGKIKTRRRTKTCSRTCKGIAASENNMKYGARKDSNHNAIIGVLRDCGIAVYDLSNAGNGIPDCLVWIRDEWTLVEIKNPETGYGRRGLNKVQSKWIETWNGGPVYILRTIDDAINFASGKLASITVVESAWGRPQKGKL